MAGSKDLFLELNQLYDSISIEMADSGVLQHFRVLEPKLIGVLEQSNQDFKATAIEEVVLVKLYGQDAGITSLVTNKNNMRPDRRTLYSRIDLVIVPKSHRNLGIAKLAILGSLIYALNTRGQELYSISCLAGHSAVEKVLENLGFVSKKKNEKGFIHQELSVDNNTAVEKFHDAAKDAAQVLHYKSRQRQDEFKQ